MFLGGKGGGGEVGEVGDAVFFPRSISNVEDARALADNGTREDGPDDTL